MCSIYVGQQESMTASHMAETFGYNVGVGTSFLLCSTVFIASSYSTVYVYMHRKTMKGGIPMKVHMFQNFVTGKPKLGEIVNHKCNSATFFNPPFLQKAEYGDYIELTEFTVTCRSHGREEGSDADFTYSVSPTSEASPTQPRKVKLAGLKPGKKYTLTVTAHYSNEESIPSETQVLSTEPAGMYIHVCF